jgi:hypothetical protein
MGDLDSVLEYMGSDSNTGLGWVIVDQMTQELLTPIHTGSQLLSYLLRHIAQVVSVEHRNGVLVLLVTPVTDQQ